MTSLATDNYPQRFERSRNVVERTIRGQRMLVPLGDAGHPAVEALYTLNETAGFIWDRAGGGATTGTIATELAAAYEVTTVQALADTMRVLEELVAIRALQPCRNPA